MHELRGFIWISTKKRLFSSLKNWQKNFYQVLINFKQESKFHVIKGNNLPQE